MRSAWTEQHYGLSENSYKGAEITEITNTVDRHITCDWVYRINKYSCLQCRECIDAKHTAIQLSPEYDNGNTHTRKFEHIPNFFGHRFGVPFQSDDKSWYVRGITSKDLLSIYSIMIGEESIFPTKLDSVLDDMPPYSIP